MASDRDWADGYLGQARADLAAAALVQGKAPSATAILLQMAAEKLAKAALLRGHMISLDRAETSHRGATIMLLQLSSNRGACSKLGIAASAVRQTWVPLVSELERHQPQLAGKRKPNLEYPYQQSSAGPVLYPARHLDLVQRLGVGTGDGALLLRFMLRLAERFDEVFR